ncbi:hypothetical protein F4556_007046 [Kitasatospora gansuensis]|uniref:Small secreted protein n=1 Tax=Kitasatospora gansuensis TaxID=258050 RepID=A0A7W7WLJ1_9ACTN|nr:hypothetical protein [Kitasatospora gansuensis]MBB4951511.1 hypothetical protein [Kitasatospora gansuensis]
MTRRQAVLGAAALAAFAALTLTGCGPTGGSQGTPDRAGQSAGADDAQVQDMQQKVDAAESAAAQAESDSTEDS